MDQTEKKHTTTSSTVAPGVKDNRAHVLLYIYPSQHVLSYLLTHTHKAFFQGYSTLVRLCGDPLLENVNSYRPVQLATTGSIDAASAASMTDHSG